MKLSADPRSPYHSEHAAWVKVYLDGVLVPCILFADEEEGLIDAYVLDELGNMIIDNKGEAKRHTLYGRVEIRTSHI